jgi:hypothetical protein
LGGLPIESENTVQEGLEFVGDQIVEYDTHGSVLWRKEIDKRYDSAFVCFTLLLLFNDLLLFHVNFEGTSITKY